MDYTISTIENGLKIILHKCPNINTISASLWINQGSQNEEYQNNGISHLLEHVLIDLSRCKEGVKLKEKVENNGVRLSGMTTKEFIVFEAAAINTLDKYKLLLEVLSIMVDLPLNEESFNKEKKIVTNEIDFTSNNQIIQNCLYALWDKHSIALPAVGNKSSVNNLSFEEVTFLKDNKIIPQNSFIVILGDFKDNNDALEICKSYFQNWQAKIRKQKDAVLIKNGPGIVSDLYHSDNVDIAIGFEGFNFYSQDCAISDYISRLLTDGTSSLLYRILRQEKKFIYAIKATNFSFRYCGGLVISSTVKKENAVEYCKTMVEELNKLKINVIDENEITKTTQRYITRLAIELGNPKLLSQFIGRYYLLGRIFSFYDYRDNIQNITAVDVQGTVNKLIKKEKLVVSLSGEVDVDRIVNALDI